MGDYTELNKICIVCNDKHITVDEAICENCLKTNNEVLDLTKKHEQFKKEFNSLFYADTWEHWYVNVKEFDFFQKRWIH